MKDNKYMLNVIFESLANEFAHITPEDEAFRTNPTNHSSSISQEQIESYIRNSNIVPDVLISMLDELLDCIYF